MAIYVPGTQSYQPNWQPFVPDYKFLSNVLDYKTAKYNANFDKLNNLYGKVVFADLSREDNISKRDQYVKNLSNRLEKISGLDFSLAENVDKANELFSPFYKDKLIISDMLHTKTYKNKIEEANELLNSTDEAKRRLYWEQGVKGLNYQMKDFLEAKPEDAIKMQLPKYIQNPDLYNRGMKILKDSGLKMSQEFIDPTGHFIIKQTNGKLTETPAFEMVTNALMGDPLVAEAYQLDAYIKAREYAENNNIPLEEGKKQWASQIISKYEVETGKTLVDVNNQIDKLTTEISNLDLDRSKTKVVPGSDQDNLYQDKISTKNALLARKELIENSISNLRAGNESGDVLINKASNLLINANLREDFKKAALDYSRIDAATEMKENKYTLEAYTANLNYALDMNKLNQEYKYRAAEKNQEFLQNKELKRLEFEYNKALKGLDFEYDKILKEMDLSAKNSEGDAGEILSRALSGTIPGVTGQMIEKSVDSNNKELLTEGTNIKTDAENLILQTLEFLQTSSGNSSGNYTLKIKGINTSGNINYIKNELRQLSDQELFDTFVILNQDFENITNNNPQLYKNNIDKYKNLQTKNFNLVGRMAMFNKASDKINEVYWDNFNYALQTEKPSFYKEIGFYGTIFNQNKKLLTRDQYINIGLNKAKTAIRPDYFKGNAGEREENKFRESIGEIYDKQIELLNETLKSSNKGYKYVDVQTLMQGKNVENASDLISINTTTGYIGKGSTLESKELLYLLATQYKNTPQQDRVITLDEKDLDNADQIFLELINSKEPYQITYNKNIGEGKAAYSIVYKEDDKYKTLNITFPQSSDINPQRYGGYNFSTISSLVEQNGSYRVAVPNGGEINVLKNSENDYIASIKMMEYNKKTGNYISEDRSINLSEIQRNNNVGVEYIDQLFKEIQNQLYEAARLNHANMKG